MLPTLVLALSLSAPPPELPLWPGAVPGEKPGSIPDETVLPNKAGENPPLKRITSVSKPTISIYRPAVDQNTGCAIVIAPGGGYTALAWEHEGTMVAEWLQSIGVTGVLLKYRVPRRPETPKGESPLGALQDAQRAISLTRSKAKEWGIDANRVGMLGFSAGGHLTAWTGTNSDKRSYPAVDDADQVSCRPDFIIPIYPGGILVPGSKDQIKPEIRVSKDTPPAFLVVSADDKGSFDSTVQLFRAIRDAGVSGVELHVYPSGGHGWGMKPNKASFATWTKRTEDWLLGQGYLSAKK